MKKLEFEKGDLVRIAPSHKIIAGHIINQSIRKFYGDVGIVLGTKFYTGEWPPTVSVYWSILQTKERICQEYLELVNEKA